MAGSLGGFFYIFPFFFFKTTSFLGGGGAFFKLIFFLKGHFSNLTSKNDVVLHFPSNLTVLTNGVAKMQLFGSLGGYFITFRTLACGAKLQ
jgi:hypothetical protein